MSGKCDKLIKKSKSKAHSHKCSNTLRTEIFSEPGHDKKWSLVFFFCLSSRPSILEWPRLHLHHVTKLLTCPIELHGVNFNWNVPISSKIFLLILTPWSSIGQKSSLVPWYRCNLGHLTVYPTPHENVWGKNHFCMMTRVLMGIHTGQNYRKTVALISQKLQLCARLNYKIRRLFS